MPDVISGKDSCPYCEERRVDPRRTSLAACYPEKARYWSNKNPRGPERVFPYSTNTYYWDCPDCGNDYSGRICDIVEGKRICPYCSCQKVDPQRNSLAALYPNLIKLYSYKNSTPPDHVSPNYSSNYLWDCPTCGFDYWAPPCEMVKGDYTCPYCYDRIIKPGFNSFAAKHPDLMDEWIFENNYLLADPDRIRDRYHERVWWRCKHNPEHRYPLSPADRVLNQLRNKESCILCKGKRLKLRHYI